MTRFKNKTGQNAKLHTYGSALHDGRKVSDSVIITHQLPFRQYLERKIFMSNGTAILGLFVIGYIIYRFFKWYLSSNDDVNYGKVRPQIIRMEQIRADIDDIDEFLTDVETIKRSNNIEIYAYIKYSPISGGTDKMLRFPILTNANNLTVLAFDERRRLKDELRKAMKKLPKINENA